VGLGRTFLGTVVGARKIELPDEGEHVLQARQLAQISCDDDRIHRVWTPVSGRIMTVNHEICGDLAKDATEIHDPPWLARIAPTRLDAETPFLTDSSDRSGDDDRTEQVEGESWFSRLSC
jgi:glycine cleavage system H lipoate-binding protein